MTKERDLLSRYECAQEEISELHRRIADLGGRLARWKASHKALQELYDERCKPAPDEDRMAARWDHYLRTWAEVLRHE